jgi:hypothetical protein
MNKYRVQLVRKGQKLAEHQMNVRSVITGDPLVAIYSNSTYRAAMAAALELGLTKWDFVEGVWMESDRTADVDMLYLSNVT